MQTLNEYPRPQLERDSYICLNGMWDYAISKFDTFPDKYDGKINVPFSPETPLSGVNKIVHPDEWLFYKTELKFHKGFIKDKVILHFGAVDQIAEVFINNTFVGKHVGGFLPFSFDIKPYLKEKKNILTVRVKDVTDTSYYSRGKQALKRGGIWYTPQSGIYMPVWMESVSEGYIEKLKITPNIDKHQVTIKVISSSETATIKIGRNTYETPCNVDCVIDVNNPKLWSPDSPYLYKFTVKTPTDSVNSYFAMRKISIVKGADGEKLIALNNQPFFMRGVLDQGYYRQGFLTPSCDEDYIKDIELMKKLGFNVSRKHIKIESLRWYYHCDRLGLLVWQDFVSGGEKYKLGIISLPLITDVHISDKHYSLFGRKNLQGRIEAEQEFEDTIDLLYNCPCIVLWTIFNEAWGQFDAKRIYKKMVQLDPTRIYDHASGWHDQGVSDTKSYHVYFRRFKTPRKSKIKNRALILSECGGYALPVKGHTFTSVNFGYKMLRNSEALENEYKKFIELDILPNIPKGLTAFIYTQLSDVEDELNGFVTYDREVVKVDLSTIEALNKKATY